MLDRTDPKVVVGTASLACYLIYKNFEPNNVPAHAALLLGVPALLVYALGAQLSPLQRAAVFAAHWALLLACTAAYRLSPLHPLAQYPGPAHAKLSNITRAYLSARGDIYRVIRAWHDQYGDVVRIGPNELSFRTVDALQPVYNKEYTQKGPYYDSRTTPEGLTQIDGLRDFAVHGARRKPWIKAMSSTSLKNFEPIVKMKAQELVDELAKRQGQEIDISEWMHYFGFDFMGHLAFGRELGLLKKGKDHEGMIQIIEEGIYGAGVISHMPWLLPFVACFPPLLKGLRKVQNMGRNFASERLAKGSTSKDIYYFMTEDEGASQPRFTQEEIEADGMVAIVAGSDTTTTVLSNVCYFLLRHPACAARLRAEIDATFPPGEDAMDFARQAEMPYLNACINEALRLLPPGLGGFQRTVKRGTGGVMVGPHFVPERTQISVHTFATMRDAREFRPLPDTFWPERWLAQDAYVLPGGGVVGREQVHTNRAAHIPFSAGPQNCAGKALALVELRAVTCALVHRFELHTPKGYDLDQWERDLKDLYVAMRGKLPVILEVRKGH
ncbi:cytochrome P450 [Phanerochaete sordida]|uniref:Cytochrome P450 n=1 Tax=Phanerochaete sordida TaxID=48140 RepID=A0A9P3GIL6_9APHY|nr:cytochrome P450 [Phanerochaete sordida]